jgi:hypothetical protein
MYAGSLIAGFAESRSEMVVDAEYCWAVLTKVFLIVQVLATEKPEKNSFVTSFDRTGKATARLSCYRKTCGYTIAVHRFLFQNNDFGKDMRKILTNKGNNQFGIERHANLKSIIVATSEEDPCMGKVPFSDLRDWLATTAAPTAPAPPAARLVPPADPAGTLPDAVLSAPHPVPLMLPPADSPSAVPAAVHAAARPAPADPPAALPAAALAAHLHVPPVAVHNWRSYAHWSVSMKLHMFESHLAFLMFEYGNLSQWLEESMEAFHKIMNQKEVQYANQRDFEKKQASIVRDLAVGSSVQVEGFGGMMNESRRRKNSSDDNVANKLAKTNAEEEQRMERIDRIESSLIL